MHMAHCHPGHGGKPTGAQPPRPPSRLTHKGGVGLSGQIGAAELPVSLGLWGQQEGAASKAVGVREGLESPVCQAAVLLPGWTWRFRSH